MLKNQRLETTLTKAVRENPNGGGGTSPQREYWRYMKRIEIIKRRRSEVERIRRHLYGDAGAKFGAKEFYVDVNGICPTITTAPDHDIQLLEVIYE